MSKRGLYTGDFSTMYTSIPHVDLTLRISATIDKARTYAAEDKNLNEEDMFLDIDWFSLTVKGKNEFFLMWGPLKFRKERVFFNVGTTEVSKLTLIKLVRFLIENTFVVNGGVCRRQGDWPSDGH